MGPKGLATNGVVSRAASEAMSTMPGKLILSFDLELMWGVLDTRSTANYGDAILGGRQAIPAILQRFQAHRIHATWAPVGLLFARSRDEMLDHAPKHKPTYRRPGLSPYAYIQEVVGSNEADDPLHFGASLIERIAQTDGQEIGTHTYSHFYCLESGQTLEQFGEDLDAACAIARQYRLPPSSIIFPRNQMSAEHVAACAKRGIVHWRGNPAHFAYRTRAREQEGYLVRGFRLADSVLPFGPALAAPTLASDGQSTNVVASRFLRPVTHPGSRLAKWQTRKVVAEMTAAARAGHHYHLWCHPHNFGRNREANLARLDELIGVFGELRDRYGMSSCTMAEAAHQNR